MGVYWNREILHATCSSHHGFCGGLDHAHIEILASEFSPGCVVNEVLVPTLTSRACCPLVAAVAWLLSKTAAKVEHHSEQMTADNSSRMYILHISPHQFFIQPEMQDNMDSKSAPVVSWRTNWQPIVE